MGGKFWGMTILVGYHKTGAYRLFNPNNGKLMVSRDVVVDEDSSWNRDYNNTTKTPLLSSILEEVCDELYEAPPIEIVEHGHDVVENHDHDKEEYMVKIP